MGFRIPSFRIYPVLEGPSLTRDGVHLYIQGEVGLWKVIPYIYCTLSFVLSFTPYLRETDFTHTGHCHPHSILRLLPCSHSVWEGRTGEPRLSCLVHTSVLDSPLLSNFLSPKEIFLGGEVLSMRQVMLVCSLQFSTCNHLFEEPESRVNNTCIEGTLGFYCLKTNCRQVFKIYCCVHKVAVYIRSCELIQ